MHPKKTVIVVGAGASQEAGLPTSTELKKSIANYLDIRFNNTDQISGDPTITIALRSCGDINQYRPACMKIREALPQAMTIDNFIEAHKGNEKIELCGKLAIIRSILQAEKSSKLSLSRPNSYTVDKLNFGSLEETWFNVFWQRISENCQAEGLRERLSTITLIIFNYDRCIEHFLYHSIQNYYELSADAAASLVSEMNIFHPYGVVGSLPWTGGPAQMDFGAEPRAQDLVTLAQQIKTFTEGTDPEASDIVKIRAQMAVSDILIFLGFAYHSQNLELLKPSSDEIKRHNKVCNCYGTAYGISDADLQVISPELQRLSGSPMHVNVDINLTCRELFNKYRRTLSVL